VRHVAFGQAFRLVDELERDQLVLEVLRDSASRVRRISVLQVRRGAAVPDAATLLHLLTERPESFDQLAVLARWLSPWARVSFLLRALLRSQQAGLPHDHVHRELETWDADMVRCFLAPAADQTSEIARAWAAARDGLTSRLQTRIAFQFRAWKVLPPQATPQ
jgi:hypothetical protein